MKNEKRSGYPPVRELTRMDRVKLSELIKAFAERSGNIKITEMLPGQKGEAKDKATETDTDQAYELIKSVMQGLLSWVEDEVTAWFMDLIGCSDRDDYDSLPFDIEVHIIDQLIAQEGFNNFFTRASVLYKKIRG
ncbi:hypothetical protein GWN26_08570 [Candidatus Saccharibacteria bacterium]|nr:hypothetical protein [Phycisphaerae bacterium]NIV99179.1 hypothetical protein [Candidatus Saccharibacteria bacterium]NIW79472.1 hypothetical protein [Calditrichia bacterium]